MRSASSPPHSAGSAGRHHPARAIWRASRAASPPTSSTPNVPQRLDAAPKDAPPGAGLRRRDRPVRAPRRTCTCYSSPPRTVRDTNLLQDCAGAHEHASARPRFEIAARSRKPFRASGSDGGSNPPPPLHPSGAHLPREGPIRGLSPRCRSRARATERVRWRQAGAAVRDRCRGANDSLPFASFGPPLRRGRDDAGRFRDAANRHRVGDADGARALRRGIVRRTLPHRSPWIASWPPLRVRQMAGFTPTS